MELGRRAPVEGPGVQDIDGLKTNVPLNADGRGAFTLKRLGIKHNVANDIYRFTVTFRWSGGTATRAVLIRSV